MDPAGEMASVMNRQGFRIYFDPADSRGTKLSAAGGDLNPHSLMLWKTALWLRPWDIAVDVGCNYGEMVVGAEFAPETSILAFEPNRSVLPYLERTLSEYDRPVELIQAAAGDAAVKNAEFARDVTWSGKSTLITGPREDTDGDLLSSETVRVTTLDETLVSRGLTSACIKIDVEGAESAVLSGAQELLAGLPHWAVMLEILHMSTREVAQLVRKYYFYLLDTRTDSLVRVSTANPAVLEHLLDSGWLYRQDALLLNYPLVAG